MRLDRALRQVEAGGDLAVGQPGDEQGEHLLFAVGEGRLGDQPPGPARRTDEPRDRRAHRGGERRVGVLLGDERRRARVQRLTSERAAGVTGDDDDPCVTRMALQPAHRTQALRPAEVTGQHDHVGRRLRQHMHSADLDHTGIRLQAVDGQDR